MHRGLASVCSTKTETPSLPQVMVSNQRLLVKMELLGFEEEAEEEFWEVDI